MLLALLFLALYVLGFGTLESVYFQPAGYGGTGEIEFGLTPWLVGAGTALGILSSLVYAEIRERSDADAGDVLKRALTGTNALFSLIVAPVVIASFYGEMTRMDSGFFQFIVAYQNGFFFQRILHGKRPAPAGG